MKPLRNIIFCQSMTECDAIYLYMRHELGDLAYAGPGYHHGDARVLRYHSRTPAEVVDFIHEQFVPDLLSCEAFTLIVTPIGVHGLDFRNVSRAIHVGAPSSIEELWQAIGRAGRPVDGASLPVFAPVYSNKSDFNRRTVDGAIQRLMTLEFASTENPNGCFQKEAFSALGEDIP